MYIPYSNLSSKLRHLRSIVSKSTLFLLRLRTGNGRPLPADYRQHKSAVGCVIDKLYLNSNFLNLIDLFYCLLYFVPFTVISRQSTLLDDVFYSSLCPCKLSHASVIISRPLFGCHFTPSAL